jgi:hypothetical protein
VDLAELAVQLPMDLAELAVQLPMDLVELAVQLPTDLAELAVQLPMDLVELAVQLPMDLVEPVETAELEDQLQDHYHLVDLAELGGLLPKVGEGGKAETVEMVQLLYSVDSVV